MYIYTCRGETEAKKKKQKLKILAGFSGLSLRKLTARTYEYACAHVCKHTHTHTHTQNRPSQLFTTADHHLQPKFRSHT